MSTTYENIEDIRRMQQEAVKRVKEMQKRAKISMGYGSLGINNEKITGLSNVNNKVINTKNSEILDVTKENKTTVQKDLLSNPFNSLIKDPERSLILILILLLVDEKADIGLIFALMYIML